MSQADVVTQLDSPQTPSGIPGLHRRTMATGERMMVCEFFLERGTVVPTHSHVHEQAGYVLSGTLTLTLDGRDVTVTQGDTYVIPGDMPHAAVANEDTVLVEVFSPPREEFRLPR